jgi:hypothetical protein
MGQYYLTVNIDKKEYLDPHKMSAGLKLAEFPSGRIWPFGMALLLSSGNGRGGGDYCAESPLSGRWAGDRIVVAGDYGDEGAFISFNMLREFIEIAEKDPNRDQDWVARQKRGEAGVNLYDYARTCCKDITYDLLETFIFQDERFYLREYVLDDLWFVPFSLERNDDGDRDKHPVLYETLVENKKRIDAERKREQAKNQQVLAPDLIIGSK